VANVGLATRKGIIMKFSEAFKKLDEKIKKIDDHLLVKGYEDIQKHVFEDTGELRRSAYINKKEKSVNFKLSPTNTNAKIDANEYGTHKMRGSHMVKKAKKNIPVHLKKYMDRKLK